MTARPHKVLDGMKLEEWALKFAPDLFSAWEYGPCDWIEFWDWMDLEYPDQFMRFEEWYEMEKIYQIDEWNIYQAKDADGKLLDKVILDNSEECISVDCPATWTIAKSVHYLEGYIKCLTTEEKC